MRADVASLVRELGRAQQAQAQQAVLDPLAVLDVVDERQPAIAAVEVDELVRADLELSALYRVVLARRAAEGAELDAAIDLVRKECRHKVRAQHLVLFVPVDRRVKAHHRIAGGQRDLLHQLALAVHERLLAHHRHAVDICPRRDQLRLFGRHVGVVHVDVPCVVVHERIAVDDELVEVLFDQLDLVVFEEHRHDLAAIAEADRNLRVLDREFVVGELRLCRLDVRVLRLCRRGVGLDVDFEPLVAIFDVLAARKRRRVEVGVLALGEQLRQIAAAHVVRLVSHHRIARRAFVVDALDRAARQHVVELIEQHFLPDPFGEFAVVMPAVQLADRAQPLQFVQLALHHAVVLLCLCLRGVGALMALVIQLALVVRHDVAVRFEVAEEVDRLLHHARRKSVHVAVALDILDVPFARTSASVAVAVDEQRFGDESLFGVARLRLEDRERRRPGVVIAQRLHMRKHRRAVKPLPNERLVGELVDRVADDLDRHEILHPAAAQHLRHRRGEAEHVGQPAKVGVRTELLHPISLAVQRLADPALAGSEVAIALDPHRALSLDAPRLDRLAYALVQFGMVLFEPYPHLRLRLRKEESVIFFDVAQLVGERARDLAARLAPRPQPRQIDVRMTYAIVLRRRVIDGFSQHGHQKFARRLRPLSAVDRKALFERFVDLLRPLAVLGQLEHREEEVDVVVVVAVDLVVADRDVAAAQPRDQILKAQFAVEARVDVQHDLLVAGRLVRDVDDLLADQRVEKIALAEHLRDALQDDAVLVHHKPLALQFDAQNDVLVLALLRHLAGEAEPRAAEFVRPLFPFADRLERALVEVGERDRLVALDRLRFEVADLGVAVALDAQKIGHMPRLRQSALDERFVESHCSSYDD